MNEDLQPESPDSGEEPAYAERDKAALEDKGALKPCEACGGNFAPLERRFFLQTIDGDNMVTRGVGEPAVVAMCGHCGLMRLHSTTLLYLDEADDASG